MRAMLTALVCSPARYAAAPHSVMPIAPSRKDAGASRFIAGHDARIAPAASAQASSAVKTQRQKLSASGGSQPAARRATRMLAANMAGATNSRAHAPAGVLMPELGQGRPKSVLGPFRYCDKSIGRPFVAHAALLSRAAARRAARAVPARIAH